MDKISVKVAGNLDGEVPSNDELLELAKRAGWSDDPGTGKAILIPDERGAPGHEVLNPLPHAPPIGWEPTPPLEEMIRQRVAAEMLRLDGDDVIEEDLADLDDFDVPEEVLPAETLYEFAGMEVQVPAVKPLSVEERAAEAVAYEAELEKARRRAAIRSREEYERRQREMREQFGDAGPAAVLPPGPEGKGA